MRRLILLAALLGIAACDGGAEPAPKPRTEPIAPTAGVATDAITPSHAYCLSPFDVQRLEGASDRSDAETWKLIDHHYFCGDATAGRELLVNLAERDDPKALRELAIKNLNTRTDTATIVPLLTRAAKLGEPEAAKDLRTLMVATAVARAFDIDRIDPGLDIAVPSRFASPTAAQIVEICGAGDADATEFCDEAVSQVMTETQRCRGKPFAAAVAAAKQRVAAAKVNQSRPARALIEEALAPCGPDQPTD